MNEAPKDQNIALTKQLALLKYLKHWQTFYQTNEKENKTRVIKLAMEEELAEQI